MFWNSGRRILAAARVARRPQPAHGLHHQFQVRARFLHQALPTRETPPARRSLILQFDGHGNDAGYITRCEAYLDSKGFCDATLPRRAREPEERPGHSVTGKRIYIPRMPDGSARAFAYVFRGSALTPNRRHPRTSARANWAAITPPATSAIPPSSPSTNSCGTTNGRTPPAADASSCPPPKVPAGSASTRPTSRKYCAIPATRRCRYSPPAATTPTKTWETGLAFVRGGWRALLGADLSLDCCGRGPMRRARAREVAYEECLPLPDPRSDLRRARRQLAALESMTPCPRTLPPGARPTTGNAADRYRRRDLLPPQYLLQRGPGAHARRIRRRSLALRYRRVGLVHPSEQFRKLKLAGVWTRSRPRRPGSASACRNTTSTCWSSPSAKISSAAKSPISTRSRSRPALPAARRRLRRNGAQRRQGRLPRPKGAAGIIDISPFTCMNGIVCEADLSPHQPRPRRHPHPQFLFRRHPVRPRPRPRRLPRARPLLPREEDL